MIVVIQFKPNTDSNDGSPDFIQQPTFLFISLYLVSVISQKLEVRTGISVEDMDNTSSH